MTDVVEVPRLAELPVVGSTVSIQRDLLAFYQRAVDSGLPLVRVHAGVPGLRLTMVLATAPEAVEEMLTRREFTKRARPYREIAAYIGDGLLTLDGDAWLAHRRVLQPLFTPRQVAVYAPVVDEEAQRLADGLADGAAAGPVDLAEASIRYALRVIARLVFGPGAEELTAAVGTGFPALSSPSSGGRWSRSRRRGAGRPRATPAPSVPGGSSSTSSTGSWHRLPGARTPASPTW